MILENLVAMAIKPKHLKQSFNPYKHENNVANEGTEEKSIILCAAILDKNNELWVGKRHSDCLFIMNRAGASKVDRIEGFLVDGNFLTRKAAMKIAISNGDVSKDRAGTDLFSEDLY